MESAHNVIHKLVIGPKLRPPPTINTASLFRGAALQNFMSSELRHPFCSTIDVVI